jgi:DUF1365 family protein
MTARLYHGAITHVRTGPVRHAFRYPASFVAVDIGSLEQLRAPGGPLGYNRRSALWLDDRDYLTEGARPLRAKLAECMPGLDHARTVLLTTPRSWLSGFNPLNAYFAYDGDGRVAAFGAEVANTFGERHLYVLEPTPLEDGGFEGAAEKALFVSPFHGVRGEYRFRAFLDDDRADLSVQLVVDGALIVSARLTGVGRPLAAATTTDLARAALSSALALPRIWLQALALRRKGMRPVMKPRAPATALRGGPAVR